MSGDYSQSNRPLVLTTPLGPDALLAVGIVATEAISQLFHVKIRARTKRGKEIAFEKLLGQPAMVRWTVPRRPERLFHGIVSRITQGGTDNEFTHYELELVPSLWLLTRRSQSRVFVRKTVIEILKEVLDGVPNTSRLTDRYPKREFCAQYRETDFAFASRLMEEEGICYFFQHSASGHIMTLADVPSSHLELPDRVRVKNVREAQTMEEEGIFQLGKSQQLVTGRVQLRDHHFQLPHEPLTAEHIIPQEATVGSMQQKLSVGPIPQLEQYEWPGDYARRFDAVNSSGGAQPDSLREIIEDNRRTAKIRLQTQAARAVELSGSGTARLLAAGYKVTLESIDPHTRILRADGQYIVTSVTHTLEDGSNYRSNDTGGFHYKNTFTCIPYGIPYRPQQCTPRPRIDGVQTAVIVGPKGEEIFTDKYGRVKVHFHWDRSSSMDGANSPWLRVTTPHAGKGFGSVCIPRVGEEVIVAFLDGDPDRPIVVGRVYNEREQPPFKLPEKKMVSGMKSNTYPGGGGDNEISMDDTKGKERMYLHAQFNQDEVVDHDQTSHVKNNRTKTVDVDETMTIGNNQVLKVGVNQTETIGSNQTTTVGQNIVIDAGTTITLRCGASKIHMTKGGVITITGTIISTLASVNASMVSPMTEVVGGVSLVCAGGLTLVEGMYTHIGGGTLATVSAPKVDVGASGELLLKGSPIKLN